MTEQAVNGRTAAGDPQHEQAPEAGGHCALDDFGILAMRGRDAAKFLQGYLTCDLRQLTPTRWLAGALCNLQGRMVGNFRVSGDAEHVLLHTHLEVLEGVRATLAKYAVFAKARLADERASWRGIGVLGDATGAALAAALPAAGVAADTLEAGAPYDAGARAVLRVDGLPDGELLSHGDGRYELWLPPAAAERAAAALAAQWPARSPARWRGAENAAGFAWVDGANADSWLPQAYNLDATGAVSFTKGCYLGQEIVTRLQHRGESKRRLYRLAVPPGTGTGATLHAAGRDVGRVVQVGTDATGATDALAVLDRAAAEAGDAALTLAGAPVALLNLPYAFG